MSSPWPTVALCVLYYYIVRVAGPRFMKDREPLNIQNLVVVYNLFQTLFSIWIFQKACRFWFTGKYNWLCQPVDYSYTQDGFDAADMTWWYFFSKFIDFIDSFFFLFRKKFSHLSTLHVVHHGIMPLTSWFGIRSVTPPLPPKIITYLFPSGLSGEATRPSAGSSTWGSTSSCTSTTSWPAWDPAYRNISGGKGEYPLIF